MIWFSVASTILISYISRCSKLPHGTLFCICLQGMLAAWWRVEDAQGQRSSSFPLGRREWTADDTAAQACLVSPWENNQRGAGTEGSGAELFIVQVRRRGEETREEKRRVENKRMTTWHLQPMRDLGWCSSGGSSSSSCWRDEEKPTRCSPTYWFIAEKVHAEVSWLEPGGRERRENSDAF